MNRFRKNLIVLIFLLAFTFLLYYAYLKGYWPEERVTCPISYDGSIIIRNDSFGEGHFGAKRRGGRFHKGIDLWAPVGTPVMAYRRGRVQETGNHPRGYGKYVEIAHNDGFVTIYAHLSEVSVEEGEFVRCGQTIGKSGRTGNASHRKIEPHVHFEISKDGAPVDPMEYLALSLPISSLLRYRGLPIPYSLIKYRYVDKEIFALSAGSHNYCASAVLLLGAYLR